MSTVKNILTTFRSATYDNPIFIRKLNGYLVIFWVLMIPISIFTGLMSSVEYVAALSLWALVAGHLAVWQAARVEEAVDEAAEEDSDNFCGRAGCSCAHRE